MDQSLTVDYPTFTNNNETVILKPGNHFTANELKSRLHQMDIDARGIQSKPQLVNLYDSTLRDDYNKFKLFDRLKYDTTVYVSKTGISLNKRMPMSSNNELSNPERSKVINLKYASHLETPYENNYEENNIRNQEIKLRRPHHQNNRNNDVNPRNAFFVNEKNQQNDDNTYTEENNNINYNNNYQENNKNSRNFINTDMGYSDLNNTNNYNNIYNNNNNYSNNYNNNYINNDKRNYNNNINEENQNTEYDNMNNNINDNKMYTNEPEEDYNRYQEPLYPKNNIRNINNMNDINDISDNKKSKEPDEKSSFSFFSSFSTFKNSKQICFHVLMGLIIICVALGLIYLYRIFSEQINGFFSQVFDTLIHPGEIISSSLTFLRNYWFIIPIILICLIIIISLMKRHKIKKRCEEILKKIVEDLIKDEENGRISEEDIYRRYVQEYGISWNKFKKSYLPKLDELRKKREKRLKKSSEKIDGNIVVFWEYFK